MSRVDLLTAGQINFSAQNQNNNIVFFTVVFNLLPDCLNYLVTFPVLKKNVLKGNNKNYTVKIGDGFCHPQKGRVNMFLNLIIQVSFFIN